MPKFIIKGVNVKEQTTLVTRKGQVTIPIAIREALNIKEGDSVVWEMEKGQVRVRRGSSVVARTAGILKSDRLFLTAEEERAAAEQAIAEEVEQRSKRISNDASST
jgi:AbrB family looped-hinge helix DNA binding protein